jgi:hypothetical protein
VSQQTKTPRNRTQCGKLDIRETPESPSPKKNTPQKISPKPPSTQPFAQHNAACDRTHSLTRSFQKSCAIGVARGLQTIARTAQPQARRRASYQAAAKRSSLVWQDERPKERGMAVPAVWALISFLKSALFLGPHNHSQKQARHPMLLL